MTIIPIALDGCIEKERTRNLGCIKPNFLVVELPASDVKRLRTLVGRIEQIIQSWHRAIVKVRGRGRPSSGLRQKRRAKYFQGQLVSASSLSSNRMSDRRCLLALSPRTRSCRQKVVPGRLCETSGLPLDRAHRGIQCWHDPRRTRASQIPTSVRVFLLAPETYV
jgi:hypothetical protein